MPLRRYALGFLGERGYREALPVLKRILADAAELDYFRGDALQAISKIDRTEGRTHARLYRPRADFLGRSARDILEGTGWINVRRTLFDAWVNRHD